MTSVIGLPNRYYLYYYLYAAQGELGDSLQKNLVRLMLHHQLDRLFDVERKNADQRMGVNRIVAVAEHHLIGKMGKGFKNLHQSVFIDYRNRQCVHRSHLI